MDSSLNHLIARLLKMLRHEKITLSEVSWVLHNVHFLRLVISTAEDIREHLLDYSPDQIHWIKHHYDVIKWVMEHSEAVDRLVRGTLTVTDKPENRPTPSEVYAKSLLPPGSIIMHDVACKKDEYEYFHTWKRMKAVPVPKWSADADERPPFYLGSEEFRQKMSVVGTCLGLLHAKKTLWQQENSGQELFSQIGLEGKIILFPGTIILDGNNILVPTLEEEWDDERKEPKVRGSWGGVKRILSFREIRACFAPNYMVAVAHNGRR